VSEGVVSGALLTTKGGATQVRLEHSPAAVTILANMWIDIFELPRQMQEEERQQKLERKVCVCVCVCVLLLILHSPLLVSCGSGWGVWRARPSNCLSWLCCQNPCLRPNDRILFLPNDRILFLPNDRILFIPTTKSGE
jgi:hypothetical protein